MTKKEFLDLLEKFEHDKCSEKEKSLLFEFYDSFQSRNGIETFSLSQKEQARVRLLQRIENSLKIAETKQLKQRKWRRFSRYAAVLIGLITSVYLYLEINSFAQTNIPEGAITLELEDGTIEIIEIDGSIKVLNKDGAVVGQQKGNELIYNTAKDSKELIYNTLTIPYGKRFELQLSDGTKAHLNAGSSLKYPVQFLAGMERKVFISGEAFLEVAKDSTVPFIVNAMDLNVRVLGTKFNIHAYPEDEESEVVLMEGLVGLYKDDEFFSNSKSTILTPGHKGSFNRRNGNIEVKPAITSIYDAWMDGELVFRNMTFGNMLKKIERHYDITIKNENQDLANKKFNASFKAMPLEEVLQSMGEVYDFTYQLEGNTVIIRELTKTAKPMN